MHSYINYNIQNHIIQKLYKLQILNYTNLKLYNYNYTYLISHYNYNYNYTNMTN